MGKDELLTEAEMEVLEEEVEEEIKVFEVEGKLKMEPLEIEMDVLEAEVGEETEVLEMKAELERSGEVGAGEIGGTEDESGIAMRFEWMCWVSGRKGGRDDSGVGEGGEL